MRRTLLTTLVLAACAPRVGQLTLQARASDLRHPPPGKQEFVEIKAPGQLVNPPDEVKIITRHDADWSTPEHAIASIISANIAGDTAWAIENWAPEERSQAQRSLSDPAVAQPTWSYYRNIGTILFTGWADLRGYRIVFLQGRDPDGDTAFVVITLKKTPDGWRASNGLSSSSDYEIIWTALHTGGIRN